MHITTYSVVFMLFLPLSVFTLKVLTKSKLLVSDCVCLYYIEGKYHYHTQKEMYYINEIYNLSLKRCEMTQNV